MYRWVACGLAAAFVFAGAGPLQKTEFSSVALVSTALAQEPGHTPGQGKGKGKGKGPDPRCPYQDGSGRGGYGPGRGVHAAGQGGHQGGQGGHSGEHEEGEEAGHEATVGSRDTGIIGGGAGGEGFVCDSPGNWRPEGKILSR